MFSKKTYQILTILLFVQIGLVSFLSKLPNFVENFYATGIYTYISSFLRKLLGWIPFSVGDIIYFLLIFLTVRFIIRFFRHKQKKILLLQFFAGVSIFYFFFYFFWGFNYSRLPVSKSLPLTKIETGKFDIDKLKNLTEHLLFKSIQLQLQLTKHDSLPVIVPYKRDTILQLTQVGYAHLSHEFPQFEYIPASLKKSLFSVPLTYMGFSGYFNPLTGEAQVNYLIPKINLPMTCSHEVAHQLGIASESEANFIGFLAANFHPDLYFQYSANLLALRYALRDIYQYNPTLYQSYIKQLPKGILKNFQENAIFWEKYKNPTEPLFKSFYHNYLKYNQHTDGIKNYGKMVYLLIAYQEEYVLE